MKALYKFLKAGCLMTSCVLSGFAVAVMIPESVPTEQKSLFENVINELTALHVQVKCF